MPEGNNVVRWPPFMWIIGGIVAVCLTASGIVFHRLDSHAESSGHPETRERVRGNEERLKNIEAQVTELKDGQRDVARKIERGFADLSRQIREDPE